MLKRLTLRDVVIVAVLEIDLDAGFSVLTGETGAGKSILIDALQLALGNRADSALVREGASRAEVSAEFDSPPSLQAWLTESGFDADDVLLLRRTVDLQGKSRAWINGSPATVTQLRQAAEHLVDIHGQHAWQGLTRPASVRELLDAQAGAEGPRQSAQVGAAWRQWRDALATLDAARGRRDTLEGDRERLTWQITELEKLSPAAGEWETLNAEHRRLSHGQALLDGASGALAVLSDDEASAAALTAQAIGAISEVQDFDNALVSVAEALRGAQAQIEDAAHTLRGYLNRSEPDPGRLAELDERIGVWVSLSRRHRRTPSELPSLLQGRKGELATLDAAADLASFEREASAAESAFRGHAEALSRLRRKTAPQLGLAVTQAMQQLGMAGGRFEIALMPLDEPQAGGLEAVELRVAGHAGSTPRALAKVASGGELSRLALAIAVTSAQHGGSVPTLIFDEIDAGVGGTVADSVGRLMKQLGRNKQVLAVTHLAQVAACADGHFVVSKALQGKRTLSAVEPVEGEARVAEVARMLGGERLSGTAHAQALLGLQNETQKSRGTL